MYIQYFIENNYVHFYLLYYKYRSGSLIIVFVTMELITNPVWKNPKWITQWIFP